MACPRQKLKRYTSKMDPAGLVKGVGNQEIRFTWAAELQRIKTPRESFALGHFSFCWRRYLEDTKRGKPDSRDKKRLAFAFVLEAFSFFSAANRNKARITCDIQLSFQFSLSDDFISAFFQTLYNFGQTFSFPFVAPVRTRNPQRKAGLFVCSVVNSSFPILWQLCGWN